MASSTEANATTGYRFGLRELLAFITLCGLQFAIIRWIGPLFGVLVGLGIAILIFSATFLGQLYQGISETLAYLHGKTESPPEFRVTDQRKLILLGAAAWLMAASALLTGGGVVISKFANEWLIRREMARKCGFQFMVLRTPLSQGGRIEVIDVQAVTPDGPFDKAGIRKGDVIYTENASKFFRETLYANRGKQVTLDVRKWTKNTTVDQAPSTQRVVDVPP